MTLNELPFRPSQIYKRTDVQKIYGGSPRGGIAPSGSFPFILLFSQPSGEKYGYQDVWLNELIFTYTGEGLEGDMQFKRGNLALLEHKQNAKRVFLFKEVYKAHYSFEGELEFEDVDFLSAPDRMGNNRTVIKFFLKRINAHLPYQIEHTPLSLVEESSNGVNHDTPNTTERKGLVTSRVGQGAYRKSLLYRWNYRCAVTSFNKREILIASHIVPWKDSTHHERLDVNNGILLSPTYDALFDKHLISFENTGKIILSSSIEISKYNKIGVSGNEQINNLSTENHNYLERHRNLLIT